MVTPYLDIPESITAVDTSGLASIIAELPTQIEHASKEFNLISLPTEWAQVNQVVFCGMGGSAIGGELASDLPATALRKLVMLIREYEIPEFVDANTLVVVVSYSGHTEEALACFYAAQKKGTKILVVTSGGQLAKEAVVANIPMYKFVYEAPPRDSLGYLFAPLLRVLVVTGVITPTEANLQPTINILRLLTKQFSPKVGSDTNYAKKIAYQVYDRVPVVVGSGILRGVARRLVNQFNEHSKTVSFLEILPELNHNFIEGLKWPERFRDDAYILIMRSIFDHPQVAKRFDILEEFLKDNNLNYEVLQGVGEDWWSQKMSLVYLGDWISYYLAILNRTDPAAIPQISALKNKLRSKKLV